MNHTKGPWEVKPLKNGYAIVIEGKNHFVSNHYGNAKANARLIAECPEMASFVWHIANHPYDLTPDQWQSEAWAILDRIEKRGKK